ncbi:MAG: acyltransferase family protein [Coriobacteriales bacterium]|nr:acyltransferase family protein [Coriobacteriales bacterium]
MSARRLEYIDVAKGIGMLAIMVGHMGFVGADGANVVRPLVSQFHVPVFFLIAGLFLSNKRPFGEFVRGKAMRLLVPFAITCVVLGVAVCACKLATGATRPPTIWVGVSWFAKAALWGAGIPHPTLPPGVGYIGAIWFLEALFVALVEARLLIMARIGDLARALVAALLAALALATQHVILLPCNVQTGLFGGLYVIAGYLFRQHVGLEKFPGPMGLLALCVCCAVGYAHCLVVSVVTPSTTYGVLGIAVSLCTSYLVLCVANLLWGHRIPGVAFLRFFGERSLTVLCVHLCCLDLGFRLVVVRGLLGVQASRNVVCLVDLVSEVILCCVLAIALPWAWGNVRAAAKGAMRS